MKVITIDGVSITVGLAWYVVSRERAALKELYGKHKGVRNGILLEEGVFKAVGMVPAGQKPPKAPSGAAMVAMANQAHEAGRINGSSASRTSGPATGEDAPWILVESVGPSEYWFVAVKNGLPLPGTDLLLSRADLLGQLQLMAEELPSVVLYSPDAAIRHDMDGLCTTHEKGFNDLIREYQVKTKKAQLRQINGIPSLAITIIGSLIVIGVLWGGYDYLIKKQRVAAAAAQAAANQAQRDQLEYQEKAEYATQVRRAILEALELGKQAVDQRLNTPMPGHVVEQWTGVVQALPFNLNGWRFSNTACAFVADDSACTVKLNRTELGINRMLMAARPDAIIIGEQAEYSETLEALPRRPSDWTRLEGAPELSVGLVSDLQLLKGAGVRYTNSDSAEIEQPVNMPPPPKSLFQAGTAQPTPQAAPVKMGVAKGTLTVSGDALWQLEGVMKLSNHPALSLTDVAFNLTSGRASWVVNMEYLIRTAAAPVLPTVALPDNVLITVDLPEKYKIPVSGSGGVMGVSGSMIEEPLAPVPTLDPTDPSALPPPADAPSSEPQS